MSMFNVSFHTIRLSLSLFFASPSTIDVRYSRICPKTRAFTTTQFSIFPNISVLLFKTAEDTFSFRVDICIDVESYIYRFKILNVPLGVTESTHKQNSQFIFNYFNQMKQGNNRGQPRKRGRKSKVEKAMEAEQKQAEEKQEPKEESEESIAKPKTKKIHHNTLKAMERKRKAEEERLRKLAENGNSSQSKEEEKRIVKQQRRGKKKKKNVEESQPKSPEDHAKMEAQVKSQPQSQPAPAQEIPQASISQQPVKKPDRIVKNIQPQSLVNYNKYYDDIFDVLKPIDEVNEQYLIFDRSKPSVYNELVGKIKKHCAVPSCDVFHDS